MQTTDDEATAVSAQAFMQAFYPPYNLNSNVTAEYLDPSSVLANDTYIDNPMNGYQYPLIQTFTALDPNSIYISGADNCISWDVGEAAYYNSDGFNTMSTNTESLYQSIGPDILSGVLPEAGWSFANAYTIYDYVSYENNHNATVAGLLSSPSYDGVLSALYEYASAKEYNLTGDQSVNAKTEGDMILTIGGQTLAAKILTQLYLNIATEGVSSKLSLLIGDYGPMMSLASLLSLPNANPAFGTLPSFGSALAFELFSWDNGTESSYPSTQDLWVRFYYQNSSADGSYDYPYLEAYSLFGRGPSEMDLSWSDFEELMAGIMMGDVGSWCDTCASVSIWCAAYNQTDLSSSSTGNKDMTPQVAGVIGAGVTLGVALLLVGAAMLFGGLRFHRRPGVFEKKSGMGGYKGSDKLASDADLNLPKHGAPVAGATVVAAGAGEQEFKKGHERVGSWELKDSPTSPTMDKSMEEGRFSSLAGSTVGARSSGSPSEEADAIERRPSFEHDDEIGFSSPTRARESL